MGGGPGEGLAPNFKYKHDGSRKARMWAEQRLASVALLAGGSRAEAPREQSSLYLYSQVPSRSFIDRGAAIAIYRRCDFTAGAQEVSAPIAIPSLRFSSVILLSSSSTMDVRSPHHPLLW